MLPTCVYCVLYTISQHIQNNCRATRESMRLSFPFHRCFHAWLVIIPVHEHRSQPALLNPSSDLHHATLVHREPLARVTMWLMMRMGRTSGLLLLATPVPSLLMGTAGATLLKPVSSPAVLDSHSIADLKSDGLYNYCYGIFNYSSVYLVSHEMHPLQRTSTYPGFDDTRRAGNVW